jgi:hypothetical protein
MELDVGPTKGIKFETKSGNLSRCNTNLLKKIQLFEIFLNI